MQRTDNGHLFHSYLKSDIPSNTTIYKKNLFTSWRIATSKHQDLTWTNWKRKVACKIEMEHVNNAEGFWQPEIQLYYIHNCYFKGQPSWSSEARMRRDHYYYCGAPQLHLNNHYNWVPRSTVASTAITNIGIETAGAPQLRLIVLGNLEHSCYLHDYL